MIFLIFLKFFAFLKASGVLCLPKHEFCLQRMQKVDLSCLVQDFLEKNGFNDCFVGFEACLVRLNRLSNAQNFQLNNWLKDDKFCSAIKLNLRKCDNCLILLMLDIKKRQIIQYIETFEKIKTIIDGEIFFNQLWLTIVFSCFVAPNNFGFIICVKPNVKNS